ncbi:MAG: cbb3-type cytochrome c oxidase N-terminal domain-containing protein [Opitutales bacterium]
MNDENVTHAQEAKGPVQKGEIRLLDHSYDGIQEYDQRLPNWWLFTLYGAIVFSFVYYFFSIQSGVGPSDYASVQNELNRLQEIQLAGGFDADDPEVFWDMMRNPDVVAEGREIFETSCVTCHGADMQGIAGLGFNLIDDEWTYGASPPEIYHTVFNGINKDGAQVMQPWGPSLGQQKVGRVVAYVMSQNDEASLRAAIEAQGTETVESAAPENL